MKTQQLVEETVMQILDNILLLDMPYAVAARKKVTKEIIELFDQQSVKLKLINEKQFKLIEHLRYQPQTSNSNNAYILYWKKTEQLELDLQSLQEGKEKEDGDTNWRKDGLPDPKDINPYDARSAKKIHDHFKNK